MDSIVRIENLSKKFNDNVLFDNVNLSIQKGQRVAMVGSSGSGKSTLLNILTKTVTPDGGKIYVCDEDISSFLDNKVFAKKIGLLRQEFDLVNNISVINNVLVGKFNEWDTLKSLISLVKHQDVDLVREALRSVSLENKIFEPTKVLSGGEKQRVAIARLLLQDPMVILADEPVSSLDPVNSRQVLRLLNDIVIKTGKTLIASMHSIEFARAYFDRMIGLRKGNIIFDDVPENISNEMLEELYKVNDV